MYRLISLSTKYMKSLPLLMAPICGHYMSEHIRHNDTITTKSDPNFTIKPLIALRNAHLMDTNVAEKMKEIYDKCQKSIVRIKTRTEIGTGFVVDASGLIVTNCHVVQDYQYVKISLWEPLTRAQLFPNDQSADYVKELDGHVVYAKPELDLALVRVFVNEDSLPTLTLSTRTDISAGEPVLVLGHPGFEFGTALGRVLQPSQPHILRTLPHYEAVANQYMSHTDLFLVHSAPAVSGFSGGPVVDGYGHVIGVLFSGGFCDCTATKATDVNGTAIIWVSKVFLNNWRHVCKEGLADKREYERAGKRSLGVVLKLSESNFFVVKSHGYNRWANVSDEYERLEDNDVIIKINGKPLKSFTQLDETLQTLPAGDPLNMIVMRDKQYMGLKVKPLFGDYPNCSVF